MDKHPRPRILVVNDDGIDAEGIRRLAAASAQFGEVYVAAPAQQCSAMSQRINIFEPIRIEPADFPAAVRGAWRVFGTPADCVKAAINHLLREKPDYVFSGINRGYNAGFDTAYSGTIGAAMEGLMKGARSIAFSSDFSGDYAAVDEYLLPVMAELMAAPLPAGEMWNVNFPCGQPCRGIARERSVAPMQLYQDLYEREELGDGALRLHNAAQPTAALAAPEGSDIRAVLTGWVSIGRLRCRVL